MSSQNCLPNTAVALVKVTRNAHLRVQSLGRDDPLEKEMATHSSVLAWEIKGTEEPDGLQSIGPRRVGYVLAT